MKNLAWFRPLLTAALAVPFLLTAVPAAPAHGFGGNSHSAGSARGFGHEHGFDHRFDHDRFFFHHHDHFFFVFDFAAFGYPWWYPDYYWYASYYPYSADYSPAYDPQYWTSLAVSVQTALAQRGYYHGPVDGEIGSDSRDAIRAFQAAQRMPVTGLIDPKLLNALGVRYRTA